MRNPWPLLFTATLAVVTTLSLMPQPPQSIDLGWDKLNHALAFAVLTVLARRAAPRTPLWGVGAWLLAWGVWIEGAQALGSTRHAEVLDVLADGIGIAAGSLLTWIFPPNRRRIDRLGD